MIGTLCLLTTAARAAEGDSPASRQGLRKAPAVTVLDLSGRLVGGSLVQAGLPGEIQLDVGGKPVVIPAGQVVWLELRPQAGARVVQWFVAPPAPSRQKPKPVIEVRVVLRDGQILGGVLRDPRKPDTLALEHRLLGSLDLPLGQIREIRMQADAGNAPGRKMSAEPAIAMDVLWLSNGDRIEGILHSLGSEQVVIELASGRQTPMPAGSVQVVRLAEVPASAPASQPVASAWLRLRSGERIAVSKVSWNPVPASAGFTYQGKAITVPAAELVGIEPISPTWQWLSEQAPNKYEHHPLIAPSLRWQVDATAAGAAIHCNGSEVLHGIGMPVGSTIRYDLSGAYAKLVVWPILDDSSGDASACKARIVVDGQLAWQGTVKAFASPSAVTIDLQAKRELLLQVEAGEGGDVLARFVWAWPVLAK